MPFGAFALLSLFYAVIGVRVIRDLWINRKEAFDLRFTDRDRALVDQSAFFLLVPVSVLLHEFGHAVAIWSFGGKVIDFNYYVFAGSVSYREPFSNTQQIVVAAAGTIVNIILCALALAVVFLKRRPYRAAINELLFQFAVISGINALIFYPLLDLVSGMEGDWTQMYDGGNRNLSILIGIVHAGILFASYQAWQNPRFRRALAERTGLPTGSARGILGGMTSSVPSSRQSYARPQPVSPEEAAVQSAIRRVASGWSTEVTGAVERRPDATLVSMTWSSENARRVVAVVVRSDRVTSIVGATVDPRSPRPAQRRELYRWPDFPSEDDLMLQIRIAMEIIDGWPAPTAVSFG
jgi:hypothetical protein